MRPIASVTLPSPIVRFGVVSPGVDLMTQCQSDDLRQVLRGARGITTIDNPDDQAALVRATRNSLVRYQHRQWLADAHDMADVTDPSRFDRSVVPTLRVLGHVLGVMAQTNRPLAETLYHEITTNPHLSAFYPKPQPMDDAQNPVKTAKTPAASSPQPGLGQQIFGAWHLLVQILTGEWWRRKGV